MMCTWIRAVLTTWVAMAMMLVGHAQPGGRVHSENKKAIKVYRQALELARDAMAPGADKAGLESEVEALLTKALSVDPEFSEVQRILAGMRFQQGRFAESEALYRDVLGREGQDWIRDHFSWAEAARFGLEPDIMLEAMGSMRAIPGVLEGPDTARIRAMEADAAFMQWALENPVDTDPMPLPPSVSTPQDEYFPSLWRGGEGLVFTRRVADVRFRQGQEDLYVAIRQNGEWEEAQPLRGLNTSNNEGAATLSGDGNTLCFTVCREADRPGQGTHRGSCDLYISRRDAGGRWGRPVNLGAVNTGGWESQPSLSPDGRTLYFTRGFGRSGRRQHDVYMSFLQSDGQFSEPERLPDGINTPGQEMRPFLHPDGRHLYFASDGHPGMGGLDLFMSVRDEAGQWGQPVNLGYPLNTPSDESGIVVASDGVTGYFSREVDGQLDLHEFLLPRSVAADPTSSLEGVIQSEDGVGLPQGEVRLLDAQTGAPFAVGTTGADARYHIPIPTDRDFVLWVGAPGHLFHSQRVEAGSMTGRQEEDFKLDPLAPDAEVVLRNVFFDSGSSSLSPDSEPELRQVSSWLAANPRIRLEIGGHTDDVGSAPDNLALSAERASSVLEFLVDQGARTEQLTAVGYGQTRPAVDGQTDDARRQNRRTSLRITGVE